MPEQGGDGKLAWVDLGTTDIDSAQDFYRAVFGWSYDEFESDEGSYYTAMIDGAPAGGMMAYSADQERLEMPSTWTVFFATADLDGDVRRVAASGGVVVREPFEIPGGERIAVIADPLGAVFALATFSAVGAGQLRFDEPGSVCWIECQSRDLGTSMAFYEELFGWKEQASGDYVVFERNGEQVAGLMATPEGVPAEIASTWFTYWLVDDLDATSQRVERAGGSLVVGPIAIDEGRFTVIEDPTGAVLGLFEAA